MPDPKSFPPVPNAISPEDPRDSKTMRIRRPVRAAAILATTGALLGLVGCQPRNEYAEPPPPEVDVARPIERPVTDYLEFTGTTRAYSVVDLRARVSGYLQEIHFEDGARVEKGQLLLTIDPAPFRARVRVAQAELQKAKAELDLAEQELGRLNGLLRRNAVTTQELEIERAKRDSAAAVVAAAEATVAEAELELGYTVIRAPISGRIGRHLVDVGNLVQVEQTLLGTIEGYDPIFAYFTISEGDLLSLRDEGSESGRPLGDTEEQRLEMQLGGESTYPYEGHLDFADLGVDPDTGTMQLRGIFPNADRRILPGLYAKIRTAVGSPKSRLLVPERALGTDQQGEYVLVVDDEGKVQYRPVTLGRTVQGMRVVTDGLAPEEWIVVNGVQRARPGTVVEAIRGEIGAEGESLATWVPVEDAAPSSRTARAEDAEPSAAGEAETTVANVLTSRR